MVTSRDRRGRGLRGAVVVTLALLAGRAGLAQQPVFHEHVEVSRVIVDARATDPRGRALTSLTADDFRVLVDGAQVPLESVEWMGTGRPGDEGPAAEEGHPGESAEVPGRLIVLLFEKDFAHERMVGLMRMKHEAAELVAHLLPADQVAVASFDSHLKLWLDFTNDHARLTRVVEHSILFDEPGEVAPGPAPSLAAHFDVKAARGAASPEAALEVLGRALEPIPGAKSLVFFGWGLGRLWPPYVVMDRHYGPARAALVRGRVTVYSLDITDADLHTLEAGLQRVAADTGGFYVKTHLFPALAMARLEGALEGYYELVIEKPDRPPGRHAIEVQLTRRQGTVSARPFYDS
jgi:VWFA-related protein